ncbi:hypothetical protein LINGRAHAP2_LOCUS34425 [Linum grandiflorum]
MLESRTRLSCGSWSEDKSYSWTAKGGRYKGALERSKSQHAQSKSQVTIIKLIYIQRFYYYIRTSY